MHKLANADEFVRPAKDTVATGLPIQSPQRETFIENTRQLKDSVVVVVV